MDREPGERLQHWCPAVFLLLNRKLWTWEAMEDDSVGVWVSVTEPQSWLLYSTLIYKQLEEYVNQLAAMIWYYIYWHILQLLQKFSISSFVQEEGGADWEH